MKCVGRSAEEVNRTKAEKRLSKQVQVCSKCKLSCWSNVADFTKKNNSRQRWQLRSVPASCKHNTAGKQNCQAVWTDLKRGISTWLHSNICVLQVQSTFTGSIKQVLSTPQGVTKAKLFTRDRNLWIECKQQEMLHTYIHTYYRDFLEAFSGTICDSSRTQASIHSSEHDISGTLWGNFLDIWHKFTFRVIN